MGMGNGLLVGDTPENREVAADGALFFALSSEDLTERMQLVLGDPQQLELLAAKARDRASSVYNWEGVADAYEALMSALSEQITVESGSKMQ
jgi:glycosyltransferase involved in cell wall biosynthesis